MSKSQFYFGLHYDLHASVKDTELGTRCSPRELVPQLRRLAPDFVQTDCKGHAGYTSWFSRTPGASLPPGLKKDAMAQWRAATRQLGLPLHCHYSGIWDKAAGKKHPDWCVVTATGQRAGAPFGQNAGAPTGEKMCPRSPYLDKLMLPQMFELIDRYGVDGFWIDGDLWAVEPCYCARCRKAYGRKPPKVETDPDWPRWWLFTLESFQQYVTRYCDAVHRHKPGVRVCSNWLQTFGNPGAPTVPTDWISGDNAWVWGLDGSRCEARFLSTRRKPWDIMLWSFYCSHGMGKPDSPWTFKPTQMLMQEAAVLLSFGGSVQIYETSGIRDGRLVPWRIEQLRTVGQFIQQRRALCQNTETIPQLAVLHSEHHVHATARVKSLQWGLDTNPVRGAAFALLENHFGVDVLDEWALTPRLREFPVIVAPECHALSDAMVVGLKDYVRAGGKLLVTGAALFDHFGGKFLGVTAGKLVAKATYHAGHAVPLFSEQWRLVKPTTATTVAPLYRNQILEPLPHPAATINRVGKGKVAYIPANVFRDFEHNRYPLTREFIGTVVRKLADPLNIEVQAPTCVDIAYRQKPGQRIIHLVNLASGIPNQTNNGAIDEIPPVGPITIKLKLPAKPRAIKVVFERTRLAWRYSAGQLTITVPIVQLHAAVVIESIL